MDEVEPENRGEVSEWIHAAAGGSRPALERVIDWLSPLMLSWARLQAGPHAGWPVSPEDVVQDVWLRTLPKLPHLAPHAASGGRLTPALLGVVRHVLRHRVIDLRRAATRNRLQSLQDTSRSEPGFAAKSSGPLAKAERSERFRLVQAALDKLTCKERALYVKRLFEELSIDELCAEFDMNREAVVKARQRVRHKLKAFLAPHFLPQFDGEHADAGADDCEGGAPL
ncbi:MAG: sigma-70 family RNA polymerase sigma factor [Planctomycetes bacterium]|nr:sigma-70 family RNA polymerase sigma factor [Planctomycetota bacterium]